MNNMKTIACLFVNERITEENYIDQRSYDFITKDDSDRRSYLLSI